MVFEINRKEGTSRTDIFCAAPRKGKTLAIPGTNVMSSKRYLRVGLSENRPEILERIVARRLKFSFAAERV
jgi:hypothetical protein